MALASEAKRLTLAHRQAQVRRAALVAALVSVYFKNRVRIEDTDSVERWLAMMVPKVLDQHDISGREAARYANALRKIEVPGTNVPYQYEAIRSINEEQIRESLRAAGVNSYLKKVADIRRLPAEKYDPQSKSAMIDDANKIASERVARAVARHTQNGSRRTLEEGAKNDPLTIGYVRVTKSDPCFFCAMLASRGLEGGLYQEDSFDISDPRFVGTGTAKVHDGCGCSIKPVYNRADQILADNQKFTDQWAEFSGDGDGDALTNFRRHYEGREAYLKV